MPPKTEASLSPSEEVAQERMAHPRTYSDYPTTLSRYRWLVLDAKKDPSRMFNQVAPLYTCKVCGLPEPRRDNWPAHVDRHMEELDGKRKPPPAPEPAERMNRGVDPVFRETETPDGPVFDTVPTDDDRVDEQLWKDILAIVTDSLGEKNDGLVFGHKSPTKLVMEHLLPSALANDVYDDAVEAEPGIAPFCNDCSD